MGLTELDTEIDQKADEKGCRSIFKPVGKFEVGEISHEIPYDQYETDQYRGS
jgi:hypothetical protein